MLNNEIQKSYPQQMVPSQSNKHFNVKSYTKD